MASSQSNWTMSSSRYTSHHKIGSGAYGVVYSAIDTTTFTDVALKGLSHVFDDFYHAKHVLRELKLLRLLKHPNLIECLDIVTVSPSPSSSMVNGASTFDTPSKPQARVSPNQRLILVTDLMDANLLKVIRSSQPLTLKHIRVRLIRYVRRTRLVASAPILNRD